MLALRMQRCLLNPREKAKKKFQLPEEIFQVEVLTSMKNNLEERIPRLEFSRDALI